ncbi:MAG TPA: hypothetical protein DEG78_08860 [Rhodobacteraceae bacterium]|nr:hypothetical protein [Marinovum sp.]HBY13266.1 hypothetical protein [Paracoccaceae bacterium]
MLSFFKRRATGLDAAVSSLRPSCPNGAGLSPRGHAVTRPKGCSFRDAVAASMHAPHVTRSSKNTFSPL